MRAVSTVLTKTISVRVTEEEHKEYMERGGSKYFRGLLSGCVTSGMDIESVVRKILASSTILTSALKEVPNVIVKDTFDIVADQGADDEITNSIIGMFNM